MTFLQSAGGWSELSQLGTAQTHLKSPQNWLQRRELWESGSFFPPGADVWEMGMGRRIALPFLALRINLLAWGCCCRSSQERERKFNNKTYSAPALRCVTDELKGWRAASLTALDFRTQVLQNMLLAKMQWKESETICGFSALCKSQIILEMTWGLTIILLPRSLPQIIPSHKDPEHPSSGTWWHASPDVIVHWLLRGSLPPLRSLITLVPDAWVTHWIRVQLGQAGWENTLVPGSKH